MWLPLASWVVFVCSLFVAFAAVSGIMDRESDLCQGDVGEPALLVAQVLLRLQKAVVAVVLRIRQTIVQSFVVSSVVVLLLWIAAFLYGSFYYSYMPRAAFSTPVHYYYRCVYEAWLLMCVWWPLLSSLSHSCLCLQDRLWIPLLFFVHLSSGQHLTDEEQETCVYECVCICIYLCVLNMPLNIKGFCILLKMLFQVLTFGQAYQISLQLEMPDSPTNQEQGMFMIRAACFSRDGGQVASSSRHVSFIKCCSACEFIQSDNASSMRKLHWLTALLCVSQASKQLSASSSRFVSTSLTHNNLLIAQPGQSQIRAAYASCRALLQQKVILVLRWLRWRTCQLKTDTKTWSQ